METNIRLSAAKAVRQDFGAEGHHRSKANEALCGQVRRVRTVHTVWRMRFAAFLAAIAWLGSALADTSTKMSASSSDALHKLRYSISEGAGWSVCESYVKFLNRAPATEEPPACDLKLSQMPGMREPDWQTLDIEQNLDTVHQIELILGSGRIEPAPEQDFDKWKEHRRRRVNEQGQRPRLRRTQLALAAGGPVETILAYDWDTLECGREVAKARRGEVYDRWLNRPNFFLMDPKTQHVMGGEYWVINMQGELWIYEGKPYYLTKFFGGDGEPLSRAQGRRLCVYQKT